MFRGMKVRQFDWNPVVIRIVQARKSPALWLKPANNDPSRQLLQTRHQDLGGSADTWMIRGSRAETERRDISTRRSTGNVWMMGMTFVLQLDPIVTDKIQVVHFIALSQWWATWRRFRYQQQPEVRNETLQKWPYWSVLKRIQETLEQWKIPFCLLIWCGSAESGSGTKEESKSASRRDGEAK